MGREDWKLTPLFSIKPFFFLDAAVPAAPAVPAVLAAPEPAPQSAGRAAPAAIGKAWCFQIKHGGIFLKVCLHFSCPIIVLTIKIA